MGVSKINENLWVFTVCLVLLYWGKRSHSLNARNDEMSVLFWRWARAIIRTNEWIYSTQYAITSSPQSNLMWYVRSMLTVRLLNPLRSFIICSFSLLFFYVCALARSLFWQPINFHLLLKTIILLLSNAHQSCHCVAAESIISTISRSIHIVARFVCALLPE